MWKHFYLKKSIQTNIQQTTNLPDGLNFDEI